MRTAAITAFIFFNLLAAQTFGQCETIANSCAEILGDNFISDGQTYRALIYDDQVAEFKTTLYGGATYRLAAMAGKDKGNIVFSVYDQENHLLFTNEEHDNSEYWDFKINSTMDCIIEMRLDQTKLSSGCAVLLIGFER